MTVIRINKTCDYTVMSNNHFREKEMSLKAKGLLSLMLSLPDDWDYSIEGLVSICKENETAIKSTLKELKRFGYLKVTKLLPNQTESGRIEYAYDIFEQPIEKQDVEKQGVEILGVEFQPIENQGQLNTKESNTKELSTNVLSTKYSYSEEKIPYFEIIDYLNRKADKHFRPNIKKTKECINARWKEGFRLDDFRQVIDNKCSQWLNNKDMNKYLRPQTLFGTKFESYLNEDEQSQDDDIWAKMMRGEI